MEQAAVVAIMMGSETDRPLMTVASDTLTALGIRHEVAVVSAHRSTSHMREYVDAATRRGVKCFICGAGMSAALPGVVAAETTLPVIGVPLGGSALSGVDALYSIVQMPGGIPVATMAIGSAGAKNAAILAARILALGDPELAARVTEHRAKMSVAPVVEIYGGDAQ